MSYFYLQCLADSGQVRLAPLETYGVLPNPNYA